jgi:hypothetical protein
LSDPKSTDWQLKMTEKNQNPASRAAPTPLQLANQKAAAAFLAKHGDRNETSQEKMIRQNREDSILTGPISDTLGQRRMQ